MRLLRFLLECAPGALAVAVGANILSGVCTAAMLVVINAVLIGASPDATALAVGFVSLVVVLLGARSVSAYLTFNLSHRAILALRTRLASVILRAPLIDLEALRASTLLSAFTENVNVVVGALPGIPALALNTAILGGCFVFMIWLFPLGGAGAIGVLVFAVVAYLRLTKKAGGHFMAAQRAFDAMFGYYRAITEGIKELKLHRARRNAYYADVFLPQAHAYRDFMFKGTVLHHAAHILIYVLILAAMGVILFALPEGAYRRVAVGYILVLLFIGPPIETILLWVPAFSRANIALAEIERLHATLSSARQEADAAPLEVRTSVSTLELRDVTFTYPHEANDREFTLGPVSLRFSRGESVFVVGGNGSGKSTLAKVLCGLYHPTSGQILLDGTVVGDGNREWYREHFSVVFSEIFLFDRLAGIDPREVERRATTYLTRLGLNRVVSVQDGMFSTTALSHGQRKRLALLVAYLEDRPIYIFDEWAADQDPDFKRTFYMELIPELRAAGKTVIVITHDAYHDVADRIVRLEEGRVVESVGSRDGVRVPEHMRPNGVLL